MNCESIDQLMKRFSPELLWACLLGLLFVLPADAVFSADQATQLEPAKLGDTQPAHAFGKTLLCGQPSAKALAEAKRRGIQVVVTLRTDGEIDWDEAAAAKDLGLEFHQFGFRAPNTLTDEIFDKSLKILANRKKPVLLHCASANRVGAIWLAHRVLNDGAAIGAAREEAQTVGLATEAYEQKALEYIESRRAAADTEKSVRPGINEKFLDPKLNVDEWLGRFEVESREVYAARDKVVKACRLKPGHRIADVGAGTGFFSRMFASAVGSDGQVYAVDISPRFVEHIETMAEKDGIKNIETVLGGEHSVRLRPDSVDRVFICDTYHHFEYPQATLASIHQALAEDGELIVIDFERIPGKSREFILGHVRAGKEQFRKEIEAAGFEFVEEVTVPEFQENYFLRFRKA